METLRKFKLSRALVLEISVYVLSAVILDLIKKQFKKNGRENNDW